MNKSQLIQESENKFVQHRRISDSAFALRGPRLWQKTKRDGSWTAYAAEGISSTSLSDRDQEIRELRQQVQDLTGVLEAMSLTQRQLSEREVQSDWFSQNWKSWQDSWWHDEEWTKTPAVGSWWDDAKSSWNSWQDLDRWAAPFTYPSQRWDVSEPPHVSCVLCELPDVEEGCSEMEDDHWSSRRETGYQGHELLTMQAFVDGRIPTETLLQPDAVESILKVLDAKAGWIQEDESKLLLRKALFSVERGKDESLRQYTTKRLAQIEAASAAALVTMPTTTWGTVLKEDARLSKQSEQNLNTLLKRQHEARWRCESTQYVRRGKWRGHHRGSCQTCSALLHGSRKIQRTSAVRKRENTTYLHSTDSKKDCSGKVFERFLASLCVGVHDGQDGILVQDRELCQTRAAVIPELKTVVKCTRASNASWHCVKKGVVGRKKHDFCPGALAPEYHSAPKSARTWDRNSAFCVFLNSSGFARSRLVRWVPFGTEVRSDCCPPLIFARLRLAPVKSARTF